jgi:sodium-dependent dicarboxylate transporter 2/3/5
MAKILIIDDENEFRESLSKRLTLRKLENITLCSGVDAVKTVRNDPDIDVVLLDRKMPEMSGEEVLKEIKKYRPEIQVIMLTGHGTHESALETGRLDAFTYLDKLIELDRLIEVIGQARERKVFAMEMHEIVEVQKGSLKSWLIGSHNSRPGFIILGLLLFLVLVLMPPPSSLIETLSSPKTGGGDDKCLGYADYLKMEKGQSIANFYSDKYKLYDQKTDESGKKVKVHLTVKQTAFRAQVMLGVLLCAALFWASGAIPIGITALFVGVCMYFLGILKPDDIAQAYAKDSVIFIFGVLAMSAAITKTGLDRRIGILLMGSSKSLKAFLFLFLPLLSISCAFLSEHALVAFIMPVLIVVYASTVQHAGVKNDFKLGAMLILSVCFAANCGGPGSPAAGGRNAVMMGILADYGIAPTFGQWVMYGLPFVPVMAIVIGIYFYLTQYRKLKIKQINISNIVKNAAEKIGPMNKNEYITAAVLVLLIVLWITGSDYLGLGGPVILAVVLLNLFRILSWRDVSKIQWEVVALYAAATAMGKGLACTGGALFMAKSFINILPESMKSGEGLAIASSIFTGIVTNFMSDGATVSAIGPITVPMATLTQTHPWMVGLSTAFASSFAHMFLIGTPNNAIAYAMAKNPITGERLISLTDFMKHGFVILILSMAVLFLWTILGYWTWIGFK